MSVQARELLSQIESGFAPIIVDVRSGWEFQQGSVPGAIHVPFWRSWLFDQRLKKSTSKPIVVYCEHGPRAVIAKLFLHVRGFEHIHLLKGHMLGWRKSGLAVETH